MLRSAVAAVTLASCAGVGIVACGTLLGIEPDTTSDDASSGSDGARGDALGDAPSDAPTESSVADSGADGPVSCIGREAGTACETDGAVCFSDASCGACLQVTGTCVASGECCNGGCEPFSGATNGTCSGMCSALGKSCANRVCCLPYTCTDAGNGSVCVQP